LTLPRETTAAPLPVPLPASLDSELAVLFSLLPPYLLPVPLALLLDALSFELDDPE
jgi:hypothetical protein